MLSKFLESKKRVLRLVPIGIFAPDQNPADLTFGALRDALAGKIEKDKKYLDLRVTSYIKEYIKEKGT